jgi:hypothetical protein
MNASIFRDHHTQSMELSIASLYIIINSTFSTLLREANWVE